MLNSKPTDNNITMKNIKLDFIFYDSDNTGNS